MDAFDVTNTKSIYELVEENKRLREQVRWIPKNEGIPDDPSLIVEVYTRSGNFEYRKVYDLTAAVAYWRYRQPPEEVE